jgi:hypothetical protein
MAYSKAKLKNNGDKALLFLILLDRKRVKKLFTLWDVGSGTRRENHINFYNRYLLLLEEEYRDEEASRFCSNW